MLAPFSLLYTFSFVPLCGLLLSLSYRFTHTHTREHPHHSHTKKKCNRSSPSARGNETMWAKVEDDVPEDSIGCEHLPSLRNANILDKWRRCGGCCGRHCARIIENWVTDYSSSSSSSYDKHWKLLQRMPLQLPRCVFVIRNISQTKWFNGAGVTSDDAFMLVSAYRSGCVCEIRLKMRRSLPMVCVHVCVCATLFVFPKPELKLCASRTCLMWIFRFRLFPIFIRTFVRQWFDFMWLTSPNISLTGHRASEFLNCIPINIPNQFCEVRIDTMVLLSKREHAISTIFLHVDRLIVLIK